MIDFRSGKPKDQKPSWRSISAPTIGCWWRGREAEVGRGACSTSFCFFALGLFGGVGGAGQLRPRLRSTGFPGRIHLTQRIFVLLFHPPSFCRLAWGLSFDWQQPPLWECGNLAQNCFSVSWLFTQTGAVEHFPPGQTPGDPPFQAAPFPSAP